VVWFFGSAVGSRGAGGLGSGFDAIRRKPMVILD